MLFTVYYIDFLTINTTHNLQNTSLGELRDEGAWIVTPALLLLFLVEVVVVAVTGVVNISWSKHCAKCLSCIIFLHPHDASLALSPKSVFMRQTAG